MTNDILDMIQAEVDGQNSPEASIKLAELCRQDAAIRSELDAALSVGKALDTLSDARLPDGFSSRVMNALPDQPSWAVNRRPAPARSSIRLARRPWLNLAYGLVVGVFVTFAVMTSIQPETGAIEGVSGTMMTMDSDPVIEQSVTIDDVHSVDVTVWEDAMGISARIEGGLPENSLPSIVIEAADGKQIIIPIRVR